MRDNKFIEIIVKTIDEFNSQLQSKSGNAYVLFTASYNDEGVRWCPDCRNAEPYLDKKLSDSSISEVIVIEVNRADYKGNPNYPFRLHEQIKLQNIPTLLKFKNNKIASQCIENECLDDEKVTSLINS